eukprot:4519304-Prymnesium_polylepis.1
MCNCRSTSVGNSYHGSYNTAHVPQDPATHGLEPRTPHPLWTRRALPTTSVGLWPMAFGLWPVIAYVRAEYTPDPPLREQERARGPFS